MPIPQITQLLRFRNTIRLHDDFILILVGRRCRHKLTVRSRHFKRRGITPMQHPSAGMIERQFHRALLDDTRLQFRAVTGDVRATIVTMQRKRRESHRNRALVPRVDIVMLADINDRHHRRVLILLRETRLGLPDIAVVHFRIIGLHPIVERRDLHEVEGHVRVLERAAPAIPERMQIVHVRESLSPVGLPLVPECASDCEWHERVDHGIPKCTRLFVKLHFRSIRWRMSKDRRFGELRYFWHGAIAIRRDPRLDVRATPRRHDHAHRHLERMMEREGVVKRQRRKELLLPRRKPLPLHLLRKFFGLSRPHSGNRTPAHERLIHH